MISIFNRDIKFFDQLLAHLVKEHCQKQAAQLTKSGVVVSETDLNQILDKWIEILNDVEQKKNLDSAAAAAEAKKQKTSNQA